MTLTPFRSRCLLQLAVVFLAIGSSALWADTSSTSDDTSSAGDKVVRLNEFDVVGQKTSAQTQAITEGKLDTVQPQSTISAQTIADNFAPSADYATIANIAPSMANVETEGPGLSESKMLSMRGFQDGQYNVTYDGIPFGDVNGATHHTTSYFPAKVLGGEVIDRGPGTAATIGENTFGGTVGLLSKDPRPDRATVLTLSDGSWNTFLGNLEINSGIMPSLNGASIVGTYQYLSSDGYRTFSYLQRNTWYLKYLQPIGQNTTLTVVANYNNIKFNNPGTVTQGQINAYGRNYGLDNNPFDPNNNYYPYNYQQKQADFEYIGLDSKPVDDIHVQNKAYTYYYNNDSHENSTDPVVGSAGPTKFPGTNAAYTGPNYVNTAGNTLPGTGEGPGLINNDDPGGRIKVNAYRVWGDTLAVSHGEGTWLEEKAGIWAEYVRAVRYAYDLDYAPAYLAANPQDGYKFGAFDPTSGVKNNVFKPGYQWFMHLYNKTFNPYIDAIWTPMPKLTIEAGVKFTNYTIDLEAPVNQGPETPDFQNYTYSNIEPSASANYKFTPNWSAYAQVAEGTAYPIVTDEEDIPNDPKDPAGTSYNPANLKEEYTINYQVGTVFKTDRFNADADVYVIDIDNLVSSVTDPNDSTNTINFQSKGAWMSGVEAEATYYLGEGLSVYANGSLNRATYKTDSGVPSFNVASLGAFGANGVPNSTGAIGAVFNHSGWFASVTDKYIGPFVVYSSALINPDLGLNGQTATGQPGGPIVPVLSSEQGGFSLVDAAIGYAYKMPHASHIHSLKFKLEVDNVLDRKVQVLSAVAAQTASITSGNSYNVLPTRNWFLTVSTEF